MSTPSSPHDLKRDEVISSDPGRRVEGEIRCSEEELMFERREVASRVVEGEAMQKLLRRWVHATREWGREGRKAGEAEGERKEGGGGEEEVEEEKKEEREALEVEQLGRALVKSLVHRPQGGEVEDEVVRLEDSDLSNLLPSQSFGDTETEMSDEVRGGRDERRRERYGKILIVLDLLLLIRMFWIFELTTSMESWRCSATQEERTLLRIQGMDFQARSSSPIDSLKRHCDTCCYR